MHAPPSGGVCFFRGPASVARLPAHSPGNPGETSPLRGTADGGRRQDERTSSRRLSPEWAARAGRAARLRPDSGNAPLPEPTRPRTVAAQVPEVTAAVDRRTAAWLDLALSGVPPAALASLLRDLGDPTAVVDALPKALARTPQLASRRAGGAIDPAIRERSLAWLALPGNELLAWDDPDYPNALLELPDPPPALFFAGHREVLAQPALAIVGSRRATPEGVETARAFARALSGAGLVIVSGLALGIDGAAHQGALDGTGSTIAVVGTGLDRVYPARHRDLARAIRDRGALLSEFPPGTPPLPHHFPQRNRLISGLSRGVLVVEGALSSGSLLTARAALEQGREVFAIPGSIHSPLSKGPHRLIRDGAKLVETAQDVLDELALPGLGPAEATRPLRDPPCPAHAALLAAMGTAPVAIDQLAARSGLPAEAIAAGLIELELAGRVAAAPGGRWQRLS
jgi:DNA processing protein